MRFSKQGGSSLAGILTLCGLCACASISPEADIQKAQDLVEDYSGHAADWQGPWAVHWQTDTQLSAKDTARLALQNHAGLRASVEAITQARADYVQAHLLPNPVLNLSLGFPSDGLGGTPGAATLLQPLAALWERPGRIDGAESRLRASILEVSVAALELVALAELRHTEVVFAARDQDLEVRIQQLDRERLALVEGRLAQGEATQIERNQVALDGLAAAQRTVKAGVRHDRAQRQLLLVCGVATVASLPQTDGRALAVPVWTSDLSEQHLMSLAMDQRLDIRVADTLAAAAVNDADLAELKRIPEISAGVTYRRNFSDREAIGPTLAISLPIFDSGSAQLAKMESIARAASAEVEKIRQAVVTEVRIAWVELRGALDSLERQRRDVLSLAVENRELADQALAEGVSDRGTALDTQRRELLVRLNLNQLESNLVMTYIELKRAVGGRLISTDEAHGIRTSTKTSPEDLKQ